ncbi:hypothetical protein VCHA53O466_50356 [Vibrio chagasii]|nr:hypothetical protein VCHA53O466_50356 [Vibrio chagasii]
MGMMEKLKERVVALIVDTEEKLDLAQLDGRLPKELWLEKRIYLRSLTYIAYDINTTGQVNPALIKELIQTVKFIKVQA